MAKITIFGMAGTGKSTTAKMLGESLGYEYLSTGNMFRAYADSLGMTLLELEEASRHTDIHDKKIDMNTKNYGMTHDNFIFESRLAWYFIPDSYKIAIICDFDTRVGRIAQREKKSFDQALSETKERETLIKKRYKEYYHIDDLESTKHFDIIVDSTYNNPDAILHLILNDLKEKNILN